MKTWDDVSVLIELDKTEHTAMLLSHDSTDSQTHTYVAQTHQIRTGSV